MNDGKPWYLSKAVWGALVAILASGLQLGGFELGLLEQGQLTDALVALAGSVGGLVALYGRLVASHAIVSKSDMLPPEKT
ncbi:hypothetical protein GOZ89_04490 [Agrobacterium vitis]|uniref:Uncharacterized protein n=1 Tax=Agrobacterium vitis TaxID=373 RepID=A0A368NSF8_AGRVI|nr:hypothetical protein [Agrobacterium vitis]KAA3519633.1 hypothetical protein DXM22_01665 [Agrobacterium vitis]KAA3532155.1 hypothetical protein DXT89_02055 [Agrobacterium vitis]MCF1475775.1 iron-containing alcohol dehydrogenase family protein [Agrobacterium vitis]MUZ94990.1 hypothetical protein [Agrobacterium vitis]MVA29457.1 hypothetical protein [Agrobacterium vitis]